MASPNLQAVCLIEKDANKEVLWVWSYPCIDPGFRELLMRKCSLAKAEEGAETLAALPFTFGHFAQSWYYLCNFETQGAETLPKVVSFCVVVLTNDFNPEKYEHLAGIFGQAYLSAGSPVPIVAHYLSVFTQGQVTNPPAACQPFSVKSYDARRAYVACSFKEVVQLFGVESILIFNALLLKKRVVVYAPTLDSLLKTCRALPLFVWHRQNWNVVYPSLELEEGELATLAPLGTYVAGFTDASAEGRTDLYDLFVNVPAGSITVATHAKDSFAMTKLHKDIALRLMECVQDDEMTDQAAIKELSVKTKELLANLKSLAPEGERLSVDVLHARKLTPATENFLFSLAAVEGLAQL